MSLPETPVISTLESAPKRRVQREMQAKYPYSMNFGVTAAMHAAIEDMASPLSPFSQSDVGRHALHQYLLANSERYRRVFGIGRRMNTGNGNA
jgi:hypothetical protein